jgi:hypothetical protein
LVAPREASYKYRDLGHRSKVTDAIGLKAVVGDEGFTLKLMIVGTVLEIRDLFLAFD